MDGLQEDVNIELMIVSCWVSLLVAENTVLAPVVVSLVLLSFKDTCARIP
jgi:hypothetical protein